MLFGKSNEVEDINNIISVKVAVGYLAACGDDVHAECGGIGAKLECAVFVNVADRGSAEAECGISAISLYGIPNGCIKFLQNPGSQRWT